MRGDPAPFQAFYPLRRERYEWLPAGDPDELRLRQEMQEGGPGLYVVWCPVRRRKVVIEAYPPVELRDWQPPSPWQRHDRDMGRLVAYREVAILRERRQPTLAGEVLDPDRTRVKVMDQRFIEAVPGPFFFAAMRRNNRPANRDLRRHAHVQDRVNETVNKKAEALERQVLSLADEMGGFAEQEAWEHTPHVYNAGVPRQEVA